MLAKAFVQEGLLVEKGRRQTHGGYTVVYDINLHVLEALPFAKTRHAFPTNQSKDRTGPNLDPAMTLTGAVNPVDLDRSTQLTQTVHEPSLNHDAKASLPRAKAINEYPKPEWADPGVWADYLKNRKLKNKPNTATAYKRFCDDIARLANDEWPPGRLLEHAAAEGWAGIYDPRNKRAEQEGTSISGIGRTESAAKRLKQQISASSFGTADSGGGTSALRSELRDRLTHVSARPLRLGRHEH